MQQEEFTYRGHTFSELKKMNNAELSKFVSSRARRNIKRGFTEQQKKFIEKVKKSKEDLIAGKKVKTIRTHCRNMIILPVMVGLTIGVHDGRAFVEVEITPEKIGYYLGEFTYNRKRVQHKAPGVGATRGSSFVSVK